MSSNPSDDLSPEQTEKIATFQGVTNESSTSSARELLASCGWDVESAVATYFAIHQAGGGGGGGGSSSGASMSSSTMGGISSASFGGGWNGDVGGSGGGGEALIGGSMPYRPSPSPPNSHILASPSPAPLASASASAAAASPSPSLSTHSRSRSRSSSSANSSTSTPSSSSSSSSSSSKGWLGSGFVNVLGRMFGRKGSGASSSSAAAASSSSSSSSSAPRTSQQQFLHELRQTYGPHVPDFFDGTYTDAVKEAKQRGRLLFLYLHSPAHDDTEAFLRDSLATESLRNFLGEHFVSWAGTIKHSDAYRLCQTLSVASFPYVAVLAPQGSVGQVAVVFRHTGLIDGDELMRQLLLRMEAHQSIVSSMDQRKMSEEAEREQARLLREQQDLEYAESLLMDQSLKEAQEREKAEMEEMMRRSREAEAAAEAERARLAAEEEARQAALEAERAALAASLPAEPAAGEEGVVNISFRLPKGQKVQRRFLDSQPLETVHLYLHTLEDMAPYGDQYQILSNFPRKVHTDKQATLASLKLGKQILFVVESTMEEEEEEEEEQQAQ